MNELRILGIAPFESLKVKMDELAKEFPDIFFKSYVGDLEKGVEIAYRYQDQFDLIISRGGTAKYLAARTETPVIEIELSMLDLLRVIKLVGLYNSKHAFIGFSNITKQVFVLSEILEKEMDIITITDSSELPEIIRKLKNEGYSLIIGDQITSMVAREFDINTILIESGEESIRETIEKAIFLGSRNNHWQKESQYEKEIKKELNYYSYVFDKRGNLLYEGGQMVPKGVKNLVAQFVESMGVEKQLKKRQYVRQYNKTFLIDGSKNLDNLFLTIKDVSEVYTSGEFITLLETNPKADIESKNSSIFVGDSQRDIQVAAQTGNAVLIYGEQGTGKRKTAEVIANKIGNKNNWSIDFSLISNNDEWERLFDSIDSVFYDTSGTFILHGVDTLSESRREKLIEFISQYNLKVNRWILIFNLSKQVESMVQLVSLREMLDCYVIELKSLSMRKNDIGSLISLYIYDFNRSLGRQILGFEPAALQLMYEQQWPGNIQQLKRVIKQLMIMTKTSFIGMKQTKDILANEDRTGKNLAINPLVSDSFLKHNSLKEIEKQLVEKVVALHNNNRTQAAEQLEISRSTLWRILK